MSSIIQSFLEAVGLVDVPRRVISICEQVPCDGQWPGHNCQALLNQIVFRWLPGGQAQYIATGWPPGHEDAARDAYNREWSRQVGRQMRSDWR